MNSTTATATIQVLRTVFARFGIPESIVSDNGPQFTSSEFTEFCHVNGIRHVRVPPYHPSSNGLAERAVQTFKKGFKKMSEGSVQDKISHFLFSYRITPQTTTGISPAELLLGRALRSRYLKMSRTSKSSKSWLMTNVLSRELLLTGRKCLQETILVLVRSGCQVK